MIRVSVFRGYLSIRRTIHNLPKGTNATIVNLGDNIRSEQGGQNLTERYSRLERSLRAKGGLVQQIENIPGAVQEIEAGELPRVVRAPKPAVDTFHGLVVPKAPKPPEPDECCMSGCAVCVNDLYEDALTAYNESVTALRASLTSLGVSEDTWPPEIKRKTRDETSKKSIAFSAFEEMERALAAKHAQQSRVSR